VHAFVLSLVLGVEDLVEQIVGQGQQVPEIGSLRAHIEAWHGNADLRDSAVKVVSAFLSRTSTRAHLKALRKKRVISAEQIQTWEALRPTLAHGRTLNYDDERLWEKRNYLIMMFHRLALRLLNYRGDVSDYMTSPPGRIDFQWAD